MSVVRSSERAVLWIAVGAFLITLIRHLPVIDEPFNRSLDDSLAIEFSGAAVKNWERFGFPATRGQPITDFLPTDPPILYPYLRHPPLLFWAEYLATRLFGLTEFGLRSIPVLSIALAHAFCALLVARRRGAIAAAVTTVILATSKMSFLLGALVNYEGPVLAASLLAVLLRDRARAGDRSMIPCAVAVSVAFLVDWAGAFTIVALLILEIGEPSARRKLRSLLSPIVGVLMALTAVVLYDTWSLETWQGVRTALAHGGRIATKVSAIDGTFTFVKAVTGMFVEDAALLPALLFVAGVVLACLRFRRDPLAVLSLALLAPALLNVAAFPARAFDHHFWTHYALPCIPIGAILVFETGRSLLTRLIGDRRAAVGATAAAASFLVFLVWSGVDSTRRHIFDQRTDQFQRLGRSLNETMGLDTHEVLLSPHARGPEAFYTRFITLTYATPAGDATSIDTVLAAWRLGYGGTSRTVLYVTNAIVAADPDTLSKVRSVAPLYERRIATGYYFLMPPITPETSHRAVAAFGASEVIIGLR